MPDRYTVKDYMSEVLLFGGIHMSRAEIIRHLRMAGGNDRVTDLYLMGMDRKIEIQKRMGE
jgi:hypothetical protein